MKRCVGKANRARGFLLIEIMFAMTILAIALSSLAGLTLIVARRSITSSLIAHRMGALIEQAERLHAIPFDSLPSQGGCTTVANHALPHKRCVSIVSESARSRRVQIVITPSLPAFAPDTLEIRRSRSAFTNPFAQ